MRDYALVVALLFLLRIALAFVVLPVIVAYAFSVVMTVVFVGLPIYALFRASSSIWSFKRALGFVGTGVALHVLAVVIGSYAPPGGGTVVLAAVQQTGILLWTLGIGTVLGLWIKDKNMMIPVAIFLIGFDMFLVFNPEAPTAKFMREHPELASEIVATVPQVNDARTPVGTVQNLAYIGPADFLFSAAFFLLIHKFGMRARRTILFLVPVLAVYLLVAVFFGKFAIGPLSLAMLPAMVPIGLTVLIVNRREFRLASQEIVGIVLVSILSVGLAGYGVYRASQVKDTTTGQPIEPSQTVDAPLEPAPGGSPVPVQSN